jgi:hypothetical protein
MSTPAPISQVAMNLPPTWDASNGSHAVNDHNTSPFGNSQKRASEAKSIPLGVCPIHHRRQR